MKNQARLAIFICLAMLSIGMSAESRAEGQNVIIMIADGWGHNQIAAANAWNGTVPFYESWPAAYAMSTYSYESSYDTDLFWSDFNYALEEFTDSAAAATAMSTGVKTHTAAIGMGPDWQPVEHLIERAELLGRATGVVTSVWWSHATPAGFVAHNPWRYNYLQIAQEMVYDSAVDVIMGAGHPLYDNDGLLATTPVWELVGGETTWEDLTAGIAGADANGDGLPDPWTLVQSRAEFLDLMTGDTPQRVLGTAMVHWTLQQQRGEQPPANSLMPPYTDPMVDSVPTLVEMTLAALNVLDEDPDGFFLMVEGGAVDWANEENQLGRMIEELDDFNATCAAVRDWVTENSSWNETLMIVTGDHESGYLWGTGSGPPAIFSPILDHGPGQMPDFWYYTLDHSNSLVPIFIHGLGSDLFAAYALHVDQVHGAYIDNVNIAEVIFSLYDLLSVPPPAPEIQTPVGFTTGIAHPNPFNPRLTIPLDLPSAGIVSVRLCDPRGRQVWSTRSSLTPGKHDLAIDLLGQTENLASGTYFLQLDFSNQRRTQKITLLK